MAVQIVKPVDTGFPMNTSTVEADTEIEEDFTWISLNCCTYGTTSIQISTMILKRISMCEREISSETEVIGKVRTGAYTSHLPCFRPISSGRKTMIPGLVSVIIPTYNRPDYLREAVDSASPRPTPLLKS